MIYSWQEIVRLPDNTIVNIDQAIQRVSQVPENVRFFHQHQILQAAIAIRSRTGNFIERFYNYAMADRAWTHQYNELEIRSVLADAAQEAYTNRMKKTRQEGARDTIIGNWGEDAREYVESITAYGLLDIMRSVSADIPYHQAILKVNQAVITRLSNPHRGVSSDPRHLPGDYAKVKSAPNDFPATRINVDVLARSNLTIDNKGLLVKANTMDEGRILGTMNGFGMQGMANPQPIIPSNEQRAGMLTPSHTAPSSPKDRYSSPLPSLKGEDFEKSELEGSQTILASIDPSATKRKLDTDVIHNRECRCSADVTETWRRETKRKIKHTPAEAVTLLVLWGEFQAPCFAHAQMLASHLGLMTRNLDRKLMNERLKVLFQNRDNLARVKSDTSTFFWFRVADRPPHPLDAMGVYRFRHAETPAFQSHSFKVLGENHEDTLQQFKEKGSIVMKSTFSWWWDHTIDLPNIMEKSISDVVEAEMKMYRHHLREVNGKDNRGWLRNMHHGIGQQLMRQDPVYYAIYVALRPDKAWRMVSYPYYAKYAVEGDNTFFRHIDVNVPRLLETGRGGNMIQGSLSLDDEKGGNCTQILPGMHHHLGTWWERVVARGLQSDGRVHRITAAMFNDQDVKDFGSDWTDEPCNKGDVRITMPHIPHGAHGPSKGPRRTLLPWFVALRDDLQELEIVESGTWDDLAKAHVSLLPMKLRPTGLPNYYGKVPYRFPAQASISGISALSDALVCRLKWDDPVVLSERDVMLGSDSEATETYVTEWRRRATYIAITYFQIVKQQERLLFGEKSYFNLVDIHGPGNVPTLFDDSSDDEDEEDDASNDGNLDFGMTDYHRL